MKYKKILLMISISLTFCYGCSGKTQEVYQGEEVLSAKLSADEIKVIQNKPEDESDLDQEEEKADDKDVSPLQEEDFDQTDNAQDLKSPEDTIAYFLSAARAGDIHKMASSFSMKNYVEGYDPDSELAELIPGKSTEERELEIYQQIVLFFVGMNLAPDYSGLEQIEQYKDMELEALLAEEVYRSIKLESIDLPEHDSSLHKKRISSVNEVLNLHDVDGWDYRTILFSANGRTYYCGFHFVVYDGKYEILELNCPMIALSRDLNAFPCSKEEYHSIIG